MIKVLSRDTIDKIAAGEVVERPMSIVKELVENSIDAGSTSITVEIKDGGISLIRVSDNGSGIPKDEVRTAFLRHATGKIDTSEDLNSISTLGFRGEALSSISAVSRCEMITKTPDSLTAVRYVIEGGEELRLEEVGAPDGTTIIIKDVFYNTPARRKFLKSSITEASHISDLVEKIALSHPDVAFKLYVNGQLKLQTSGNGSLKDIIYGRFGKDITNALIEISGHRDGIGISGYVAKPEVSRGNRNFEFYYINGRYVTTSLIVSAIEDAYSGRMMQHQFPFAVIMMEVDPGEVDVNVHPTKLDVRFAHGPLVYSFVKDTVADAFKEKEIIPHVELEEERLTQIHEIKSKLKEPEYFEIKREQQASLTIEKAPASVSIDLGNIKPDVNVLYEEAPEFGEQISIPEETIKTATEFRIVGQVFDTYWIIQVADKMYILDQHAAHEKIYYERFLKQFKEMKISSQQVNPPVIVSLSDSEAEVLINNKVLFEKLGFETEHFGGKEYALRAMPDILPSVPKPELFKELIAELEKEGSKTDSVFIIEKTASMACKAAIKGGQRISFGEAEILIRELFTLENPYNCPHGRPTMIEFTKYDLEKKFKRVI